MVEVWLENIPKPYTTALSALAGTVEFAQNYLYTKDADSVKVMVVITHWNMLREDVKEFLMQDCTKVR